MTPKKQPMNWEMLIRVLIPGLSFFGGMIFNSVMFANSIATKPLLEKAMAEDRRYTDEKVAENYRQAADHSDANRAAMALKMAADNADLKADIRAVAAKQDLMLSLLNSHSIRHDK